MIGCFLTRPQAANYCALFWVWNYVSVSSQSLGFILSLRMNSSLITFGLVIQNIKLLAITIILSYSFILVSSQMLSIIFFQNTISVYCHANQYKPLLLSVGFWHSYWRLSRSSLASPLMMTDDAVFNWFCNWLLPLEFDCGHWVWVTMSSRYVNKMIQSRARWRLVCSLPAYCEKLLTSTLQTVWVTRQESKLLVCNRCNTSFSALFWGFVVSNIHFYSDRHFELSCWHYLLIVRK